MTEDMAEAVYEWKSKLAKGGPQSLNDFICQCLCAYFDQRQREEIDEQFRVGAQPEFEALIADAKRLGRP
jgi:hypothetical protein